RRGIRGRARGRVLAGSRRARAEPPRRQNVAATHAGRGAHAALDRVAQGGRAVAGVGMTEETAPMPDLHSRIERQFRDALRTVFGEEHAATDPLLRPSADERFGDYQVNVAMSLAKSLKQKPRDVAQAIVDALERDGLVEHV